MTPESIPLIRAVTLDLDDTLWPIAPAMARAETVLHAWLVEHAAHTAKRFDIVALRAMRDEVARGRPERLRVFRSCPLITPKDPCSSLQMLAIARAMAALCA